MEKIAIHEIPGFSFGQVQDLEGGTGSTVILCPEGAVTGVDVRAVPPAPGIPMRWTRCAIGKRSTAWFSPAAAPLAWTPPGA